MFSKNIQQTEKGCDFDFLRTEFGAPCQSHRSSETLKIA